MTVMQWTLSDYVDVAKQGIVYVGQQIWKYAKPAGAGVGLVCMFPFFIIGLMAGKRPGVIDTSKFYTTTIEKEAK
jgi:hypothetical protein